MTTADARSTILARIREAQGAAGVSALPALAGARDADVRTYRCVGAAPRPLVIAQFLERLDDYRARTWYVPAEALADTVAICCSDGVQRLAVPADVPAAWIPAGLTVVRDEPRGALDARALDACGAVLTGCAVAIAQTGTIVLDGGEAQGRRALSLVPDHHVCVVRSEQVLELVPEALAWLARTGRAGRPLTLISGPSATSDIELTRVEGVHGPRRLDVVVVEPAGGPHVSHGEPAPGD
jgi:L-lactate dehydrogenase complex protein LldG